jgi:hypothetical protein
MEFHPDRDAGVPSVVPHFSGLGLCRHVHQAEYAMVMFVDVAMTTRNDLCLVKVGAEFEAMLQGKGSDGLVFDVFHFDLQEPVALRGEGRVPRIMHPSDEKPIAFDQVLDRGPIPADTPDSACFFGVEGWTVQVIELDSEPGADRCVPQAFDEVVGQGTTFLGMALVRMAR